tara:strand:+ start:390 stop:1514 length:1125 start_codon:yes stop_codon:yes gene_type:complete
MNRCLNNLGREFFFSFTRCFCTAVLFLLFVFYDFSNSEVFSAEKGQSFSDQFGTSFSIVVLPDTQQYLLGDFKKWSHIFESQTRWIFDNAFEKNIRFVVHLGDIVETNSLEEWELAEQYIKTLDGIVPYGLAIGNHDVPFDNLRDTRLFNRFFSQFRTEALISLGGVFESGKLENAYHFINGKNLNYLIVVLEPFPRETVLHWANQIVAKHANHKTILVTHCYVTPGGGILKQGDPGSVSFEQLPSSSTSSDGEELWRNLVSRHKNIHLVLSGHILQTGVGRRVDKGEEGNYIFGLASNYQNGPEGGSGFLRIMQFSSDGKRVKVETYSPYLDKYKKDSNNRFDIDFSEGKFVDKSLKMKGSFANQGLIDLENR